ncbi:hypothetical protein [Halomonas daqiaonensis]|uniref:Uncharacterized protein n=1 Tax=Halomonas daqiaonensis TaxID=650850 RepID=A0A1H7G3X0_9GAMM|nr:hypothetical protein [Halomonas daqiaonensis]SEK31492.1 hypothetical protein SAMN04488129_101246 [Halomonas daqiaonensis]
MAYLLVMGGMALSVLFTLAWGLVCVSRWLAGCLPGADRKPARRAARPSPSRPKAAPRSRTRKAAPAKAPAKPWWVTRWLARQRSPLPLGLLALLLYGGSRLAEYGMAFRPQAAPGEFHGLVSSLGWGAAVLLTLAGMNLLALWRCRQQ